MALSRLLQQVRIGVGQPIGVEAVPHGFQMTAGTGADFKHLGKMIVRTKLLFQHDMAVGKHARRHVAGIVELVLIFFELPLVIGDIRLYAHWHDDLLLQDITCHGSF